MWWFGTCFLHNKGSWNPAEINYQGKVLQTRYCATCGKLHVRWI